MTGVSTAKRTRSRSRHAQWWVCALCVGCATSSPIHLHLIEPARLAEAEVEAPDLVAWSVSAAESAQEAADAGDEPAAQDHATRSRLYAEAAIAEAQRVKFDRARIALLEQAEADALAARAAQRERESLEFAERRAAAAALAQGQMAHAFAQAEIDEPRRLRRRTAEVTRARTQAAAAFVQRTHGLVAAVRAMRTEGPDEAVERELAEITEALEGEVDLPSARSLHDRTMVLLGRVRAARPVTAASIAALVEAASERGLRPEATAAGMLLRAVVQERRLRSTVLGPLLRAHPHGDVVVRGPLAPRMAAALRREGIRPERLQTATATTDEILLPAYRVE